MKYEIRNVTYKSHRYAHAIKSYPDKGCFIVSPSRNTNMHYFHHANDSSCIYDIVAINRSLYALLVLCGGKSVHFNHIHRIRKLFMEGDYSTLDYNKNALGLLDIRNNRRKITLRYHNKSIDTEEYLDEIADFISSMTLRTDVIPSFDMLKTGRVNDKDTLELLRHHKDRDKVLSILKRSLISFDVSAFKDAMTTKPTSKLFNGTVLDYESLLRGVHEAVEKLKGKCKISPQFESYRTIELRIPWSNAEFGRFVNDSTIPSRIIGNYTIAFGDIEDAKHFVSLLYEHDSTESVTIYKYNCTIKDALDIDEIKTNISESNNSTDLTTITFMLDSMQINGMEIDDMIDSYLRVVKERVVVLFGVNHPPIEFMHGFFWSWVATHNNIPSILEDMGNIDLKTQHVIDFNCLESTGDYIYNLIKNRPGNIEWVVFGLRVTLPGNLYTPDDLRCIMNKMRLLGIKVNTVELYPEIVQTYPNLLYSKYL